MAQPGGTRPLPRPPARPLLPPPQAPVAAEISHVGNLRDSGSTPAAQAQQRSDRPPTGTVPLPVRAGLLSRATMWKKKQALPVDPEWSRSQALFEDAVGDGTYFADPNCEWEEEVEETKHGGS